MINRFKPVWNSVIDGFGNHAPGKGRKNQVQSPWDMLHPGRQWAKKLPAGPKDQDTLRRLVHKIERNIERDKEVTKTLEADGWIVLRFWGNEISKNVGACADVIVNVLKERSRCN